MRGGDVVEHGDHLDDGAGLVGDGSEGESHDPRLVARRVQSQVVAFELDHAFEHADQCREDLGLLVLGAQAHQVGAAQFVGRAVPGPGERR